MITTKKVTLLQCPQSLTFWGHISRMAFFYTCLLPYSLWNITQLG